MKRPSILFMLALFVLLFSVSVGAEGTTTTSTTLPLGETTCNSCSDCTSKLNGDYDVVKLTEDIKNYSEICITISVNNVEFDCQEHLIDGVYPFAPNPYQNYGIYLYPGSNNIVIKNCVITEFHDGVSITNSVNNTIVNNTIGSNGGGIRIWSSSTFNTLTNNDLRNNNNYSLYTGVGSCNNSIDTTNIGGYDGKPILYEHDTSGITIANTSAYSEIFLCGVDNSLIDNVTIYNGVLRSDGLVLYDSDNNTIQNSNFSSNWIGIYIDYGSDSNIMNSNRVCSNTESDFYLSDGSGNTGTDNYCDNADGWSDDGLPGCRYNCAGVSTTTTSTTTTSTTSTTSTSTTTTTTTTLPDSSWLDKHVINISNADSKVHSFEIIKLDVSGTACANQPNSTRIKYNNSGTLKNADFEYYDSNKDNLFFIANYSSISAGSEELNYYLYCNVSGQINEGNTSIFTWWDDFEDNDVTDWTATCTMTAQSATPKEGTYYGSCVSASEYQNASKTVGSLSEGFAVWYGRTATLSAEGGYQHQQQIGTTTVDRGFMVYWTGGTLGYYSPALGGLNYTSASASNTWYPFKMYASDLTHVAVWINWTHNTNWENTAGVIDNIATFQTNSYEGGMTNLIDYIFIGPNNMTIYETPSTITLGVGEIGTTTTTTTSTSTTTIDVTTTTTLQNTTTTTTSSTTTTLTNITTTTLPTTTTSTTSTTITTTSTTVTGTTLTTTSTTTTPSTTTTASTTTTLPVIVTLTRDLPTDATRGSNFWVTLTLDVNESEEIDAVIIKEFLPLGWDIQSSSPSADTFNSETGELKWVLLNYDVYDREVKYRPNVPEDETSGVKNISGEILYQYGGMNITQPTGGDTQMTVPLVPGDTDGDGTVGDFELLTYISRWVDREVSDFDLLAAIDAWVSS